ncbi:type II toxin-antitoxin system VapC family toxin [Brevundimonas balnearis]|uniref:Ribonuclease VapC n=1 Tax=Brevundimonas balnearis TaxID=1572858 RepID=A0ABV6QZH5_9CAUL
MTGYVLDASVFIAGLVEEERTQVARALLIDAEVGGAVAPGHVILEVMNGLLMKQRRGLISADYRHEAVERFLAYGLRLDATRQPGVAHRKTLELADRHGLTVYDAAYLELAQREGLVLGAFDKALRRAGAALGVAVARA